MIPEAGHVELAALGAETCGELCAKIEVDIGIGLQVYGHDLVVVTVCDICNGRSVPLASYLPLLRCS